MITPRSIFTSGELPSPLGSPELNPLCDTNALQEAVLTEIVIDSIHSRIALLFDLRVALHFHTAWTGLLIAYGLEGVQWKSERRNTFRTAWSVIGSSANRERSTHTLNLDFFPDADFRLRASKFLFVMGDVEGLSEAPPDFAGPREVVEAGTAVMDSSFKPIAMLTFS